jgi:hypothetical protein
LFFLASAEHPLAAGRKRSQRSTPHPVFPAGGCTICVGRLHKELRQLQRRNDPRIKLRLFAEPVLILSARHGLDEQTFGTTLQVPHGQSE